jgi:hypothetical protein
VVLRREVKTMRGSYSSFENAMKESQPQIQGDGEVVIQGDITPEQFETYLAKFRRVTRSQGNAPKYAHVRIKVVNSQGDTIGSGPAIEPDVPDVPRMGHTCRNCNFE